MLTMEMIRDAQAALQGVARRTPLERAPKRGLYIKAENLQLTGAFKLRGAYNKIRSLTPEEARRGVIACSAGNHAQGIALSASKLGIRSIICMPAGAPISKVEATRSYGAEVVLVPGVYDDAAREAERLTAEHGYTFAHPFNDPYVMAGQGTIGLEILEQLPQAEQIGDEVVTVTEDEIASAILALMEEQKTVAEGAGATTVAACMFGKVDCSKTTVCLVSGGNVDVTTLSRVITKGLSKAGRIVELTTKVPDKPGGLLQMLRVVADSGANILTVNHAREDSHSEVAACIVTMVLETRNPEHVRQIETALRQAGFPLNEDV